MPVPRSYGDPCGIARALDALGERWALLVVRELTFGPKRFSELRRGLAEASPNVLSQRLDELELGGVIARLESGAYELTDRGRALHPILVELGRWGAKLPIRADRPLSIDALLVALETCFVPARAADLDATYDLRVGDARFAVEVREQALSIGRGTPRHADAVITADGRTLRAVAFGDTKLGDSTVAITGDVRAGRAFFKLFARP